MKKFIYFFFIFFSLSVYSQIPFEQHPSFETNASGHYATGLGIADINKDGWKDIIVANGNDMARQRLIVYYNNGDGTFPPDPSWQASDIDYHGQLACGDIDNDGDVDVVVSVYLGPGGFGTPGNIKVYYNQGNELELNPSFVSENFYSFSCALGDADGDGDLDIAVACGEPYNAIYEHGRIFYNTNGNFTNSANWLSNIQMGALDVEFGDVDQNGFLDLIFVCQNIDNYVFFADNAGHIDNQWDIVTDHQFNFMNSLDFGRPCQTANPCIVVSGNDQLGGDGKIKQFVFSNPIPQFLPPSWESGYVGNGSGILLAEITNDGNLDLLYGSWWGPLTILEGDCGFWDPVPAYTAGETSVVETILMSDLGKFNYEPGSKTIKSLAEKSVIYLDQQIIERVNAVYVNGAQLARSEYCYVELKNWVSFKNNIMPGNVVTIEYDYMVNGDIVISNWDPGRGNFIYYNTNNPVGISEQELFTKPFRITALYPQPAENQLNISLSMKGAGMIDAHIYDISGKLLESRRLYGKGAYAIDISHLQGGVYILQISDGNILAREKFSIR
ncbi:MAG: T9SS type A sorting domain-containing protein [Bacteroidales bacterium]|nr:T9SS type A sorting domain-containing protein [Bacteroidales bacterium]